MSKTIVLYLLTAFSLLSGFSAGGEEIALPDTAMRDNDITDVRAESVMEMGLQEAIMRARMNSVDAAVALDRLRTSWWEYRSYRADLLPEVSFKATLPAYYKQYSAYMDGEGNYSYVPNNYLQMNGALSINQKIWLTGGEISVSSSLDFMRQFGTNPYNRFMSIPVALTLRQPVFGVNNIKWQRWIEPLKLREAKARFLSETEETAIQAIGYYFQLIMARENREIARQNLENATKLYEVAEEKRRMGSISGNDLLQMELNLLDARSSMTNTESELRASRFRLASFLGIEDGTVIEPVIPSDIPEAEVSYTSALEKARENNCHTTNLRRRMLEADYAVAEAKGNMRNITLFAQVGYTGTAQEINPAYHTLKDNQIAQIGLEIPILDWGRRRGRVKVAESNRSVVESTLRREDQEFEQNLFILVERYGNQRSQLDISRRVDEIAARRYATNVETYLIGRISTLDLNDSRLNKDEARRDYVNQLYLYWYYYYQLRSITLWDYSTGNAVDADFDGIL